SATVCIGGIGFCQEGEGSDSNDQAVSLHDVWDATARKSSSCGNGNV
ncbi:hypothetical protein A2U01_0066588, partial [Trifolium medium]|nr:hypothetical protein [Trifolium medium]